MTENTILRDDAASLVLVSLLVVSNRDLLHWLQVALLFLLGLGLLLLVKSF